jgi:hypothetical protein
VTGPEERQSVFGEVPDRAGGLGDIVRPAAFNTPMAGLRSAAIARGALPVWTLRASSPNATSRMWWPELSIAQGPRT